MIKRIMVHPGDDEILHQISEVANWEECKELIQDLKDTIHAVGGVGISAIQIGVPKRVCYINYAGKEFAMINPIITWTRKNLAEFREGCLSAPEQYVITHRPQKVICKYTDENGNIQEIADGGYMSAIIQHEIDHFGGHCVVYDKGE